MIVTIRDALTVQGFSARGGFCRGGIRRWCEGHGIDYLEFVRAGIDEEQLRPLADPFADAVIRHAHRRALEDRHG